VFSRFKIQGFPHSRQCLVIFKFPSPIQQHSIFLTEELMF